jgi:hypothetical protein
MERRGTKQARDDNAVNIDAADIDNTLDTP